MFAIIRASFNQRRKTLVNGLNNAAQLPYSKDQITEALEEMGFPVSDKPDYCASHSGAGHEAVRRNVCHNFRFCIILHGKRKSTRI